jgi:hypothetical protein
MVRVGGTTIMSEGEQLAAEGRDFAHSWPREIRQNAMFQLADRRELNRLRGILRGRGIEPDDGTARTG